MATNGSFALQDQYKTSAEPYGAPATTGDATNAATANSNLSKDEVAWYFVEQYYTTLSKSPEKLHLFYGKRSQFVYGLEAEIANVAVGRQAIQDRIKVLDFQDCKVRISNVDSQASFDNIVIQVIGETSNKAAEPKKYVQTFVLAQQPSGYFVLNDILRYIDEGTEEIAEPVPATIAICPEDQAGASDAPLAVDDTSSHPVAISEGNNDLDTSVIDQKLEKVSQTDAKANGDDAQASTEATKAPEIKAAEPAPVPVMDPDVTAQELAEEDAKESEKPQEPNPTPVSVVKSASLAQPAIQPLSEPAAPQATTQPAAPPTTSEPAPPPKPMTWASRAAAAAGPRPVVPLPKTATPPSQNTSRAPNAAAPSATAAPASATATPQPSTQPSTTAALAKVPAPAADASKETSGWQTAGADSKRQNRPHSMSGNLTDKDGTMGYVKYVTDKVVEADLRNELAAHGELTYFDINRQKNCAFVEYKTIEGYQAAVSKNPHIVNGETIIVEPRRPKTTGYGGPNYARGNISGRGRGGFDGNRSSGHGGSRGSFSGQSRGRGGMPRGRGGVQANIV
ncbi:hypothetical protein CDD82_3917 [Ophiocordyceps australis]|uniref:NTF2 domain-containing protein n=1 Tax=Ophiocordyceps australis TaxID=1399860 RepID=A0A2C5ZB27_9HYPO|nr:hypothetical protein CDD82_3917 [Ophiocordyceps australis]